ncbi:hypothetical protein [Polyangium spumosum]|uniref:Uncharacterized protein n=1 Tax=Polyangium spumosum TaxID=889282 RepID=A0A6N7Q292_9BACT|nr:hypothetical protein [Polyangium spumosum]MRG97827.1 hypothetical protein [Polyangium spumosum]
MDITRRAVDGLAAVALGGPDAAPEVMKTLAAVAKAPELGADLAARAVDALAAVATGGPDAWRKVTEVLAAVAKAASERGAEGATGTDRRR